MTLDPDAEAYLVRYRDMAPLPLRELGVDACRAMRMAGEVFTGPSMWQVEDVSVTEPPEYGDPEWLQRLWNLDATPVDTVTVRVYRPAPAKNAPALVYLHGGGWSIGSVDGVDALCRTLAEKSGTVVISVDYRQAPEHPYPAALRDSWRALRWIAAGGLADLDVERVVVGGDSAGGNLAAVCALLARDTGLVRLAGQLLVYPPTDAHDASESTVTHREAPVLSARDVEWFWSLYAPAPADRRAATISPKSAATLAGLPPAAVFTAEHDPIRDDGEDYAHRLSKAGVPVERRRVDGTFHGYFPLVGVLDAADRTADDVARWLRHVLNPQSKFEGA